MHIIDLYTYKCKQLHVVVICRIGIINNYILPIRPTCPNFISITHGQHGVGCWWSYQSPSRPNISHPVCFFLLLLFFLIPLLARHKISIQTLVSILFMGITDEQLPPSVGCVVCMYIQTHLETSFRMCIISALNCRCVT